MARSGGRRGTKDTTNRMLPPSLSTKQLDLFRPIVADDRRFHHPDGLYRPAKDVLGNVPRVVVRRKSDKYQYSLKKSFPALYEPDFQAFAVPDRVLICVRRKRRKEVLHALKKTGKGGQKRPRRNWYSDVTC